MAQVKNVSGSSNNPGALGTKMTLKGLHFIRWCEVPELRVIDTVVSYQTYGIGNGQWAIEAKTSYDQSRWSPSCKEWVGSKGTRYGEEADDLWSEVEDWKKDPEGGLKVIRKAYKYRLYEAPDGCQQSYSWFMREAKKGRLHGLVVMFK